MKGETRKHITVLLKLFENLLGYEIRRRLIDIILYIASCGCNYK